MSRQFYIRWQSDKFIDSVVTQNLFDTMFTKNNMFQMSIVLLRFCICPSLFFFFLLALGAHGPQVPEFYGRHAPRFMGSPSTTSFVPGHAGNFSQTVFSFRKMQLKFEIIGVSIISPEGLAISPLIPANCFICACEPLAPESAII